MGHIIFEKIIDLAIDAAKTKYSLVQEDAKIHRLLEGFIARQKTIHLNCSMEEELDLQGLIDYIHGDMLEDIEKTLYASSPTERGSARRAILDKAASYASAKTSLSARRAQQIASQVIEIVKKIVHDSISREWKLVSSDIKHDLVEAQERQTSELKGAIERMSKENAPALVVAQSRELAAQGDLGGIERILSDIAAGISAEHPLAPEYRFEIGEHHKLYSVPQTLEAMKRHPPKLSFMGDAFSVGESPVETISPETLELAYRRQRSISFNVISAEKVLGETLDPVQHEADEWIGHRVTMTPPKLGEVEACRLLLDGEIVADHLLLRVQEILDDGTVVIDNRDQSDRYFNFEMREQRETGTVDLTINAVTRSCEDLLNAARLRAKLSRGDVLAVKYLSRNMVNHLCGGNWPSHADIDSEVEFFSRMVKIERYFGVTFTVPQAQLPDDYKKCGYLSDLIEKGAVCNWTERHFRFDVTNQVRDTLNILVEYPSDMEHTESVSVLLFDQTICVSVKHAYGQVKLKDADKVKSKLAVLEDGDSINIVFLPDSEDGKGTVVDTIHNGSVEELTFG